jgi:transcriptional regulator
MYQPAHSQFVETRPAMLHKLIRDHPLGTIVTAHGANVQIDYAPFLLEVQSGGKLHTHIPRANPLWHGLDSKPLQIIFHGPNAYITPSWYATKRVHGKVVPTWNYAVVHAHGVARIIDDKTWVREHLEKLTDLHEKRFEHPWKVSDAPAEYTDKLLGALVGLEIVVTKLEGKFKLGQNRPLEDRRGVIDGLTAMNSPLAQLAKEFAS